MGIPGLLPFVKKASKNSHIKHFSGCTVAVDAYGWLYKGAFGCAVKIGQGEPTDVYVRYCMKYVNVLLSHGLKPILVFDGRNLPAKEHTDAKRRENRKANKAKAKEALRRGDKKSAWEHFTKCLEITPSMARELIKVLRQEKIDYIIAPYEADAQMAYLAKTGIADLVLTEDSDLIVFGCPRVFFKMSLNGDGVYFDHSKLSKCMDIPSEQFQFERFRQMCILSGCDYLPSLPGIGLGRAKKVFTMSINPDVVRVLKQIPMMLKLDLKVPQEYIEKFIKAERTFLYQLVFDPRSRTLQPLNPYPVAIDPAELGFAGEYLDLELMTDICLGNVDLKTFERVPDLGFDPCHPKSGYPDSSIWSKNFTIPKWTKPAVDKKLDTKHSSTTGKITSISLAISGVNGVSSKRTSRSVTVKAEEPDTQQILTQLKDEEIISLYRNCKGTTNDDSKTVKTLPVLTGEDSSRTKRRYLTSVYKVLANDDGNADTDDSEGLHEDDSDDESPLPKRARTTEPSRSLRPRISNPFLKTPEALPHVTRIPRVLSKLTSLNNSNENGTRPKPAQDVRPNGGPEPRCIIKKNTIYDLDAPNVIVKSQYFRNTEVLATAERTNILSYRTRRAVKLSL